MTTFTLLYLGECCGICSNNRVLVGYNDIGTTNPYIASLFSNKEDAYNYVELSNQEIEFICPDCGSRSNQIIAKVVKGNRVLCPYCSDGISYPNKFIYNCLMQISYELDFIHREYKPNWCKFKLKIKAKLVFMIFILGLMVKNILLRWTEVFIIIHM
jgi:predicted RNA-binding Zn-ribbon protein involved in translation (DUF1610 family)